MSHERKFNRKLYFLVEFKGLLFILKIKITERLSSVNNVYIEDH
jgi:hypothetical protein